MSVLRFAEGTPYETVLGPREARPQPVLAPEIAALVRRALIDVVENGTARRARGALAGAEGEPVAIGGKTGTGDNKFKTFGKGGVLIGERVVNRTATLAFFLGERFYGSITAYVEGEEAAAYGFTSSLPAQLLKILAPALEPLLRGESRTAEASEALVQ